MPATRFFTVGHSNRTLAAFLALLEEAHIERVVDVRRFPVSRAMPQFAGATLARALAQAGIDYAHRPALGGRREPAGEPHARTALWEHTGFRTYAAYALTPPFRAALDELETFAHGRRCALMCAEAQWWRCHRRIIADYLLARGHRVVHLLAPDLRQEATLTAGAEATAQGILYPSPQGSLL
ncbi:MAG: DUF488 domain-containing protein [Sinobacteraceae bacterium]|nr:DUF488 domain-containing protein [Nevskiaceae bacterium]MDI3261022.1 DUF488 domain-containing protein [Nevskiaceae bacterium]